jgi:hypothetical protein
MLPDWLDPSVPSKPPPDALRPALALLGVPVFPKDRHARLWGWLLIVPALLVAALTCWLFVFQNRPEIFLIAGSITVPFAWGKITASHAVFGVKPYRLR